MEQLLILLGDGLRRVQGALTVGVFDCCGLEGAFQGAHRISFFAGDCHDPAASWHLEDVVAVVRHWKARSMCGVIVVDAGRNRSTCHGRDAYIHDHA